MWVVDIEANRAEQVLHPSVVGIDSVDEILVPATNYHLTEKKDGINGLGFCIAPNKRLH